jgi:hypothetical protein
VWSSSSCVGRLARVVCHGRPGSISLRSTEPHSASPPIRVTIPGAGRISERAVKRYAGEMPILTIGVIVSETDHGGL